MNEEQKRIASQCIADVMRDAATGLNGLEDTELLKLAESVGAALSAGFKKINEAN